MSTKAHWALSRSLNSRCHQAQMMQSELLRLVGERLINEYRIDNFDHNFGNDRESYEKHKVLETLV
jgi:hypothetical protein